MTLLNPSALWGLLGLSVPIAIHLLSRKEGKIIYVGSLRHFEDTPTQQFKSIRLNEIALLIIRMLLVAAIVLLLSKPGWDSSSSAKWVLRESGLQLPPSYDKMIDSLVAEGYEERYLAPGFPEELPNQYELSDYWRLAEELDAQPISEAIVFTKAALTGFRGERAGRPIRSRWLPVEQTTSQDQAGFRITSDSARIFISDQDPRRLRVDRKDVALTTGNSTDIDFSAITSVDSIRIVVSAASGYAYERSLLVRMLEVIASEERLPIVVRTELARTWDSIDWYIPLGTDEGRINYQHKLSLVSEPGPLLIQKSSNEWSLTKRLNPELIADENLVSQLATLLWTQSGFKSQPADFVSIPEPMMWARHNQHSNAGVAFADLRPWLWLMLIVFFVGERILSFMRRA